MYERGIISELKVCTYLIERHWEVYRGVDPLGSADLVIRQGDQTLFIEVKTGHIVRGGIRFGRNNLKNKEADLLAVVTEEGIKWKRFGTQGWATDIRDIV